MGAARVALAEARSRRAELAAVATQKKHFFNDKHEHK